MPPFPTGFLNSSHDSFCIMKVPSFNVWLFRPVLRFQFLLSIGFFPSLCSPDWSQDLTTRLGKDMLTLKPLSEARSSLSPTGLHESVRRPISTRLHRVW